MIRGYVFLTLKPITRSDINYIVEIEDDLTFFEQDKVLFNGYYPMERQVAIRNLNNPHPIQVWAFDWFSYEKNGIKRFDVNCAVQYNWYAKYIHRKILKCLK